MITIGHYRPDIVLLNDPSPIFRDSIKVKCDLIVIFGTSLQIPAFVDRIRELKKRNKCKVVIINDKKINNSIIDAQYLSSIENFMSHLDGPQPAAPGSYNQKKRKHPGGK